MSAPKSRAQALFEITITAGVLFVLPVGYYYGRERILNTQNRIYNRFFGIREDDYNKIMDQKLKSL